MTESAIAEQLGSLYGGAVRAPVPNADGSSTMRIGQKTVTNPNPNLNPNPNPNPNPNQALTT